jgi:hypothetical protein
LILLCSMILGPNSGAYVPVPHKIPPHLLKANPTV